MSRVMEGSLPPLLVMELELTLSDPITYDYYDIMEFILISNIIILETLKFYNSPTHGMEFIQLIL